MTDRKAFTLVELMVVVGIMGLMGTLSVGGYRAMRVGMEEKGVMQNVNTFIRAAYQRAQIDRQPTAIFFWNETLRARSDDNNEIVVGKAVAVRRAGRFSEADSTYLYDEFADLKQSYPADDDGQDPDSETMGGDDTDKNAFYIYPIDGISTSGSDIQRSKVRGIVYHKPPSVRSEYSEAYARGSNDDGEIPRYAFRVVSGGGNVQWKIGMAYGLEFANIELPHGYVFGSDLPSRTDLGNPVKGAGAMTFSVGISDGSGSTSGDNVSGAGKVIYALRPGSSGTLEPKQVGTVKNPRGL